MDLSELAMPRVAIRLAALMLATNIEFGAAQPARVLERPTFPFERGPTIVYDTAHLNPPLSAGRYQAIAELLRADGYRVVEGAVSLQQQALARQRMLMIVTPYAADPRTAPVAAATPVFSDVETAA